VPALPLLESGKIDRMSLARAADPLPCSVDPDGRQGPS